MLPTRPSLALQIALNLIPLLGVAFLNWSAFALFYAYWLETLAIALFNSIKIVTAQQAGLGYRIYRTIQFLLVQLGILLFYLVFIVAFIGMNVSSVSDDYSFIYYFAFIDVGFSIAILVMFTAKGLELIATHIVPKKYLNANPNDFYYFFSMRIILIHVVVVLGFFAFKYFSEWLGSHVGVVIFTAIFTLVKMIVDYLSFKNSRRDEATNVPYI